MGGKAAAKDALRFVEENGLVLQAARGPVPSLAEHVAGGPIRGSWWGHPRGHDIFQATEAVADSGEVLVCRLVAGKLTYVHRRLWPALVRLADRLDRERLARVWSEHTAKGHHVAHSMAFPSWVPDEVRAAAAAMSEDEAERQLAPWLALLADGAPREVRRRPRRAGGRTGSR